MRGRNLDLERILKELDEFLHRNDYEAAAAHLAYWKGEAEQCGDHRALLLVLNEQMGLYRKSGKREQALAAVEAALHKIEELRLGEQIGSATTFLNSATVYKAFGMAREGLPLFQRAKAIYEQDLPAGDPRFGGLYNNMGLSLVDCGEFREAEALYRQAIDIMSQKEEGAPEVAITYLNLASAAEAEWGLEAAEPQIEEYLQEAKRLLEGYAKRDGYYAFVCEKCASVFGYYGHFLYKNELEERARRIYEGA